MCQVSKTTLGGAYFGLFVGWRFGRCLFERKALLGNMTTHLHLERVFLAHSKNRQHNGYSDFPKMTSSISNAACLAPQLGN